MVDIDAHAMAKRGTLLTSASLALAEKRAQQARERKQRQENAAKREAARGAVLPGMEESGAGDE